MPCTTAASLGKVYSHPMVIAPRWYALMFIVSFETPASLRALAHYSQPSIALLHDLTLVRDTFPETDSRFDRNPLASTARERISDYDSFAKYTDKLIAIIKCATSSGEAIDMQDMFARFTMDTAGEFLFGSPDLNTLDLPVPGPLEAALGPKGIATDGRYGGFVQAFEQGQINVRARTGQQLPQWTAREFFKDTQTETAKAIAEFLEPLAKKALENKALMAAGETKMNEESFLDHLALSTDGRLHLLMVFETTVH